MVLWAVTAGLAGTAIVYRLATMRGRPELWWWAFTLSLCGIVAGTGFLVNEPAVNRALDRPNVAYLLSNLSFICAGGSVQVYIHCLRRQRPSRRWVGAHTATAAGTATLVFTGWLLAPIHDQWWPRFRDIPVGPYAWAYDGVFHVYMGAALANVAAVSWQKLRTTPGDDHGRRVGLVLIMTGGLVDVVAQSLYLFRTIVQPHVGRSALAYAGAADVLTVFCMLAIAGGTIAFLAAPRAVAQRRARELCAALAPVWSRVRELYPEVALPEGELLRRRASPGVRAERMLIETQDALRLILVPVGEEPVRAVARTLCDPSRPAAKAGEVPAIRALPRLTTRQDEERFALSLADRYRKEAATNAP